MFSHLLVFATFQEQQGSVHSSFWQHNLVYVTASSSTQLPTRQVAVAWVLQRPAATAEAYADSSGPDSGSFQQRSVHSSMWEMVLAFMKAHPPAWDVIDIRKAVLPRLLPFLR